MHTEYVGPLRTDEERQWTADKVAHVVGLFRELNICIHTHPLSTHRSKFDGGKKISEHYGVKDTNQRNTSKVRLEKNQLGVQEMVVLMGWNMAVSRRTER